MFEAITNVPGYLPMDDDRHVFDTAPGAWAYLAERRERDEEYSADCPVPECVERDSGEYTDTVACLRHLASGDVVYGSPREDIPTDRHGCGTVYGDTPCAHSDHDLGIAYTVVWTDDRPADE